MKIMLSNTVIILIALQIGLVAACQKVDAPKKQKVLQQQKSVVLQPLAQMQEESLLQAQVKSETSSSDPKSVSSAPLTPQDKANALFSEDIAKDISQSTPSSPNIPLGLGSQFDITYQGAFRVNAQGESSSDYAVGTIEYNQDNKSIYLAGHAHHNAIAEFEVPAKLSFESNPKNILEASVLQEYTTVLNKRDAGNQTNRITGMLYHNRRLLITSEIWYDASATNTDNLQVVANPNELRSSEYIGMLQLEGGAKAAGYMSAIPLEHQSKFGAKHLTGWASNYSITSRYSQGPSLYTFNPNDAIYATPTVSRRIPAIPKMVFPLQEGKTLVEGAAAYQDIVSPVWSALANARYGFIVPNSNTFMVVGFMGGIHSGIGYKIKQDTGNVCGGGCTKQANDRYNYFWLFDIDDILSAKEPYLIQPYSYGKWSHPYDAGGKNRVLGATFDATHDRLFVTIENAGRVGEYDRSPLILSYKITARGQQ